MAPIHDMRRQHYRSTDFDFYRTQAVALRSQAKRDAFKFNAGFRFAMAALATVLAITVASSMQFQWV